MTSTPADLLTARAVPPFAGRPDLACREVGVDPEIFFPDRDGHYAADLAVAVCRTCPTQGACLKWAIETDQRWGIWGGTTPTERLKLLRARAERTGGQP